MKPGPKDDGEAEEWEQWDPRRHEVARELLDHLARELAEEYIRLMKQAADEEVEKR
jgi:hypothetical protein